jgi:hypothetical protein
MTEIYGIIRFVLSLMILTSLSILIIVTMYRTTEVVVTIPPRLKRTGDPDVNSFLWIPIIIGLVSILAMIVYYSQFSILPPYYRMTIWIIGVSIYVMGMIGLFFIGRSLQREQTHSFQLSTSQIGIGILASLLPFIILSFGGVNIVNGIMDIIGDSTLPDIVPSAEITTISIMSAPIIAGLYSSMIFGKLS